MKKSAAFLILLFAGSVFSIANTWSALPAYGGQLQRFAGALIFLEILAP